MILVGGVKNSKSEARNPKQISNSKFKRIFSLLSSKLIHSQKFHKKVLRHRKIVHELHELVLIYTNKIINIKKNSWNLRFNSWNSWTNSLRRRAVARYKLSMLNNNDLIFADYWCMEYVSPGGIAIHNILMGLLLPIIANNWELISRKLLPMSVNVQIEIKLSN